MSYPISNSCQIQNLDLIYSRYFGYPSNGTFIEVGAFDGESFSNTSCLADEGWGGIYIEPVEEHYQQCLYRHQKNNVSVIKCSIGTEEKETEVYVSGALTTTKLEHVKMFSEMDWSKHCQFFKDTCSQIRLDKVLNHYDIHPNFDLLVVDVEGNEDDVLNSFDLNYWYPKMMIVELIDEHESFQKYEKYVESNKNLRSRIINSKYTEVYKDHINTIFVSDALKNKVI